MFETAPAGDGQALAQQKTGQCPSGQAAAAAGLMCLHRLHITVACLAMQLWMESHAVAFGLQWTEYGFLLMPQ